MRLSCFLSLLFLVPAVIQAQFAHESSDLPADDTVVWGVLDNGVRYAVMPNNEPPDRVSLRLFVDAGSLMETDAQAGLAHFLEHMAFNGSENYPPGELVEYLQRLGMGFGAHTNAHTGFDETVYKLELPKNDESMLREGLQVMRDYAGGLLLLQSEIDRERGVILSEKRSRDSAHYRTIEAWFDFLFPYSLVSQRLPIGEVDVIENAPRSEFVAFYNDWYTTDRMAVVATGAVEPEAMVELIKSYFTDLPTNPVPKADPDLGTIPERGVIAKLHSEPESPATTISIMAMSQYKDRPDNRANRIEDLEAAIANRIVSRRLDILSKEENAPFSEGSAASFDFLKYVDVAEVELTTTPENWEKALSVGEQQLRKALQYGFTDAELAEAKANLLQGYQQAVREAPTRRSVGLSSSLVSSISDERVFTSPEEDLKIAEEAMGKLTTKQVLKAFRESWSANDRILFVSGNLELENADAKIAEAFAKSATVEVTPPEAQETAPFGYTDFGSAGKVAKESFAEDLGIHQVEFENGLHFNFKQTDYEAGQVVVTVRFGGGDLAMPKDLDGIAMFAGATFIQGGLEKHSFDEIQRITAGRVVGVSFSVGSESFYLAGGTNADDLELQLQLLAAYLTAPGYRPEAARLAKKEFEQMYIQLDHTAEGVYRDKVRRFLAGGSYRFGFPAQDILMSRTLDEVKAWLEEPLNKSYLEISIVGDVTYDQAKKYVASTFGALGKRAAEPKAYPEARASVKFPAGPIEKTWSYETQIPRAIAAVFWPTADFWDIDRTRTLNLLAAIFRDRLRKEVREKLGEGYSPYAVSSPSETYDDYGYLMALNFSDPEKASDVGKIIGGIGEKLAAGNISSDELERSVKPMMNQVEVLRRDNSYWLNRVLSGLSIHEEQFDYARSLPTAYAEITLETLNNYAKEYIGSGKQVTVVVLPESTEVEAPETSM
ncbi:M16 family metallopeptidase [Rubellicoccus peritrichatus]|uniref:Insulinase family protein n=1 Tax=Rubellicoccus peritrichatus TaxID=3080537 RepID=A0AAQ3LDV0_9BACT|nr:insulinase family protein [Puniceicoccus sp. CR14]WOO42100.1 insulinase family protein [Puniceicoccus sp. CR14]